jgi:cysteinyl-tRNA synthetase
MNDSWIKHFIHIGDLTIDGRKMTASLNNVVTVQRVREKYSSRQIRLLFLMHLWSSTFNFDDEEMKKASNYEEIFIDFFGILKIVYRFWNDVKYLILIQNLVNMI